MASAVIQGVETCRWFKRDLKPPPLIVYKCKLEQSNAISSDGNKITKTLFEASSSLKSSIELLEVDFIVLKKMMFKLGAVIRKHKQFQAIQQFSRSIRLLFDLDMNKVYDTIVNAWPKHDENTYSFNYTSSSLPSKQMWQYLLARTHCMVSLLTQACSYGLNALQYSFEKLQSGLFVPSNVVITACVSRLWLLCAALAGKGVEWYDILCPWAVKLESSPVEWLTCNESLPTTLSSLFVQTLNQLKMVAGKSIERAKQSRLQESITVDDQMDALETSTHGQQDVNVQIDKFKISNRQTEDVGVVVARSNINVGDCNKPSAKSKAKEGSPPVPKFTKLKQLNRWLKRESVLRQTGKPQFSGQLNAKQWSALQNFVQESHSASVEQVSRVVFRWLRKPNLYFKKYRLSNLNVLGDHPLQNTPDKEVQAKTKENWHNYNKNEEISFRGEKQLLKILPVHQKLKRTKTDNKNTKCKQVKMQSSLPADEKKIPRETEKASTRHKKRIKKKNKKGLETVEMQNEKRQPADDIDNIFSVFD